MEHVRHVGGYPRGTFVIRSPNPIIIHAVFRSDPVAVQSGRFVKPAEVNDYQLYNLPTSLATVCPFGRTLILPLGGGLAQVLILPPPKKITNTNFTEFF